MQPIGLLIEFKDGRVKPANFGVATAARAENRQLVALVVDASADDAKAALEAYGVTRVVNIRTGSNGWNPAMHAAAVVSAMQEFELTSLIGLTSPAGRELLPRVAARLEAPLVMDCMDIDLDGPPGEDIPVFGQDHRHHRHDRQSFHLRHAVQCRRPA